MSQFDNVADIYEENLKELLNDNNTEKYAEYKIQLARLLYGRDDGKIMDFGCGTGRSFPYLKKYFPEAELYGCDVSSDSLKLAERYVPSQNLVVNDNTNKLRISSEGMDVIIAACVFHHIAPGERLMWMQAIADNLKEGGMFFVFEHNVRNPMTKKIVLDARNLVDDIDWMLSHKELLEMAGSITSTKIIWDGYTLFSPWRYKNITSIERFMKWCPLGAQHCIVIKKDACNA
jgi:trans-aconitate methyltransferase